MRYTIEQASDIGGVIRAARKAQQLRQDDAAGSVGVSESFMVKAERGADTVQWGKVFQILQGLGVQVVVDLPDVSGELLERQSARAAQRAEIRARRAAERLLLRADAGAAASDRRAGERTTDARVLAAARLVLAAGTAPRGARSGKRADTGASRALDIARRVLAEAGEAPPAAARTNDGEASHD
ncbi:helix-turn-helix domain-containing protein [Burkholderia multivorans]|uniref:Helix-turn-helix domain-containing protein n=5 Tax=Burkholderia multivorans TaxID=87883 RepID=A0ABD7LCQ0_9BURK|nr:helix-turn-helix domain-containing protein [Burkholderia multivorans]SAK00883.1 helix-turn-helix domain-containing protein [Burkholderia multivorans]SAK02699.1 helix-turn-helix domain-containing protein [Burkholderia multivorans]